MFDLFPTFEKIVRKAYKFSETREKLTDGRHPFDTRNVYMRLPAHIRNLFDDEHYAQATFEAYKFIDNEIQRYSSSKKTGFKLMMEVFNVDNPLIRLTSLDTVVEKDEQRGYQFIYAGSVLAIRNPRGHKYDIIDSPEKCLDHICLASMLLRRLDEAGYR